VPGGLELLDFEVMHPRSSKLRAIYQRLDIEVFVVRGDLPGMALIKTSGVAVVLCSLY
jgi:hypothetical protein